LKRYILALIFNEFVAGDLILLNGVQYFQ